MNIFRLSYDSIDFTNSFLILILDRDLIFSISLSETKQLLYEIVHRVN